MSTATNHRSDLQGLRGIAVLLVVLYHAGEIVPGGFIGVDVFFVLSGFVIGASILREADSSGSLSLSNFYSRRVRRILPAHALMAVTTLIVFAYFLSPFGNQQVMAKTSMAASVWLSNMALAKTDGGGYFAPGSDENPFLHTWSLGVEEQFYIFLPIAMAAIFVSLQRRPGNSIRRVQAVLAVSAVLSFLVAVALVDFEVDIDPGINLLRFDPLKLGFYLSIARFWELLAGVLLATLSLKTSGIRADVRLGVGLVGMALLVGVAFAYDDFTRFPGLSATLPVAATLLLIWAGTASTGQFATWMSNPVLRFMGDNSYSWYLWHWPAIVLTALMWSDSRTALVIAGAASLVPAALSRRFMEEPIRRNQSIVGKKALALAAVCVGVPLAVGAIVFLGARDHWGLDKPAGWDDIPVARDAGCHVNDVSNIKAWASDDCLFASDGDAGTILVLGDSHASSLSSAVIARGTADGYDVGVWSGSGCPFILGAGPSGQLDDCRNWVDQAVELMDTLNPVVVVIANRSPIYLDPQAGEPENPLARLSDGEGKRTGSHNEAVAVWGDATASTIDALAQRGIKTVVLGPVPEFWPDFIDEYSLARPDLDPSVSRTELEERQAGVDAVMRGAAEGSPHAAFVDPTDTLCPGDVCFPYDDDGWLYYDPDHLNERGAATLEDLVAAAISDLVP